MRITEVEAYCFPDDSANHCRMGKTQRNAPMWGPAGHAYVYLCYGIHHLLNIVSDQPAQGAAVLLRSAEVVAGVDVVAERRRGRVDARVAAGPGNLAASLGLDRSWNEHALYEPGGLMLLDGAPPKALLRGPRVGIAYALPRHRKAFRRFAVAGSAALSENKSLRHWRNASGRLS